MIEIKRASELGESARKKISEVFVDGFGEHLTYFSKDRKNLERAFEHMFVLDHFYVGIIEEEIAGITTCSNGKAPSINQSKKELIKHLGFFKGTIANIVFKREFQKPPIVTGDQIASVGFVATASKHRGKGVATAILNYLLTLPQYNEYVLQDIADTNTPAINLYEKLGYKEFIRIKQKHSKITGINYYLSMKYIKPINSSHFNEAECK